VVSVCMQGWGRKQPLGRRVPVPVRAAGGGDASTAMAVAATLATARTVTPRAVLSVAAGVAASVVAAALAAAGLGYVMVASTPTEAE
jgi:hypothetical protein